MKSKTSDAVTGMAEKIVVRYLFDEFLVYFIATVRCLHAHLINVDLLQAIPLATYNNIGKVQQSFHHERSVFGAIYLCNC